MARKSRTSSTCALESCSRQVRYENSTFPFCNYHAGLKSMRSQMSHYAATDMNGVREMLYNPDRTMLSRLASTAVVLSSASQLPYRVTARMYKCWAKALKGASPDNPEHMHDRRESLLDAVGTSLEKDSFEIDSVSCSEGSTLMPQGGYVRCHDHSILMATRDGDSLMVDPAASAPLVGVTNSVSDTFGSGESTCGDGLYMASLYEYAEFSSVSYRKIASDNDVLWENRPISENSEVEAQRKLLSEHPVVLPPVIYRDSPELDPVEESSDPLDELFADEPSFEELQTQAQQKRSDQ